MRSSSSCRAMDAPKDKAIILAIRLRPGRLESCSRLEFEKGYSIRDRIHCPIIYGIPAACDARETPFRRKGCSVAQTLIGFGIVDKIPASLLETVCAAERSQN